MCFGSHLIFGDHFAFDFFWKDQCKALMLINRLYHLCENQKYLESKNMTMLQFRPCHVASTWKHNEQQWEIYESTMATRWTNNDKAMPHNENMKSAFVRYLSWRFIIFVAFQWKILENCEKGVSKKALDPKIEVEKI